MSKFVVARQGLEAFCSQQSLHFFLQYLAYDWEFIPLHPPYFMSWLQKLENPHHIRGQSLLPAPHWSLQLDAGALVVVAGWAGVVGELDAGALVVVAGWAGVVGELDAGALVVVACWALQFSPISDSWANHPVIASLLHWDQVFQVSYNKQWEIKW